MSKSIFYYKQLTATEVGSKGTHEIYVRMPNDFDHEDFFQGQLDENDSVLEKKFIAKNLTAGHEGENVPLRYVYFYNSNKEKRIPSLGEVFKANNVQENDVVRIESRIDNGTPNYYITFLRPNEISVSPKQFYFSIVNNEQEIHNKPAQNNESNVSLQYIDYLAAIRTKPFLLLAGISGTGKSRIVKELAYASCPAEGDLRKDPASPGNYCLVEVKPNWNDSTELLGYETVLEGGGYVLTKFVKFLVKAMRHPDVPFFVCLDEMNLAPVEQYFAEFLSVLESRKDMVDPRTGRPTIQTEPLIPADIFKKYKYKLVRELFPSAAGGQQQGGYPRDDEEEPYSNDTYDLLETEGLRIPRNLIVVGTVNMDDTTYQFSRKVIDRAMTIEMNEVDLDKMFDTERPDALSYPDEAVDKDWFLSPCAQSREVLKALSEEERNQLTEKIKETLGQTNAGGEPTPGSLEAILGRTSFRIAYRVVNELILHYYALRWQDREAAFGELYAKALDNILMMKVLPRIEGNEDVVKEPLENLRLWTSGDYPKSNRKIEEMQGRLGAHFTSFWP